MTMFKNLTQYTIWCLLSLTVVLIAVTQDSGVSIKSKSQSKSGEVNTKLVLVVVADQFPFDYVTRFTSKLYGGLGKLFKEGTVYSNAQFDYAKTNTCPGHATIATGLNPNKHGVVDNWWFDTKSKEELYCIGTVDEPASPRLLQGTTIGDSMKEQFGGSKVHVVSGKDRSAIMLAGKDADAAWWFGKKKGGITSSKYYMESLPTWVDSFNNSHLAEGFGSLWMQPQLSSEQRDLYSIKRLKMGKLQASFPYPLGGLSLVPNESFFRAIYGSPLVDSLVSRFAQNLIANERLGQDNVPDFLGLSFSALDTVGHSFGPNSEEVLDTLLKLDQELDQLLQIIDSDIGLENVLVVFTSDHGVKTYPEFVKGDRRIESKDIACFQRAGLTLVQEFGSVFLSTGYFDWHYIRNSKVDLVALKDAIKTEMTSCEIVSKVIFADELKDPADEELAPWQATYFQGRSPDFFVEFKENISTHYPDGTGHGTAYRFDRHVPVVFMGKGFQNERIDTPYSLTQIKEDILNYLATN